MFAEKTQNFDPARCCAFSLAIQMQKYLNVWIYNHAYMSSIHMGCLFNRKIWRKCQKRGQKVTFCHRFETGDVHIGVVLGK